MRKNLYGALLVCLLAVALSAAWPPACAAAKDYLQPGFQLMKSETLGPLGLGSADTDIVRLLGEAAEKSPAVVWGADGREHQKWYYPAKGIELGMVLKDGGFTVDRIRITGPCDFKTKRGIGIGSPESDVRAAYNDEIGPQTAGADRLVAGSVYGGLIFALQNGAVSAVFIGAAAE